MSSNNPTIGEVLVAVNTQGQQLTRLYETLSQKVESQFTEALEAVHLLSEQMEQRFTQVDERFEQVDLRFQSLESKVTGVESQMVTKTYLDDKLADLRGDLTLLTRQEDQKLLSLVELLFGKRLMTKEERQHIMALQPFAAA